MIITPFRKHVALHDRVVLIEGVRRKLLAVALASSSAGPIGCGKKHELRKLTDRGAVAGGFTILELPDPKFNFSLGSKRLPSSRMYNADSSLPSFPPVIAPALFAANGTMGEMICHTRILRQVSGKIQEKGKEKVKFTMCFIWEKVISILNLLLIRN